MKPRKTPGRHRWALEAAASAGGCHVRGSFGYSHRPRAERAGTPALGAVLTFPAVRLLGLIYESLWVHYLKLFLGHATYAQSLVLAIFIGGLAVGAWLAGTLTLAGFLNLGVAGACDCLLVGLIRARAPWRMHRRRRRTGGRKRRDRPQAAAAAERETEPVQGRPGRLGWAGLLKRVFDIHMQRCPNCGGGELKIIAAILELPVIEKILTHRALNSPESDCFAAATLRQSTSPKGR